MGIVCPHERHTDREVGTFRSHVCFDCTTVIESCEHQPAPEPAPEPEAPAPRRPRKRG